MNQASGSGATAIEFKAHLTRQRFALRAEFTLPAKGCTVLFGPSGSGKTTCLRVMAGLEPEARGLVRLGHEAWMDSDAGTFVPAHLRSIGYVFQDANLFEHLSVRGNLEFGFNRTPEAERRHHWRDGLEMLGIGHLLDALPADLSGGERQRVAVARALATSPRILLMDEPLAALDAAKKKELLPWLEQLHETLDIPLVYVTHSLDETIRLADHVVVLDKGKVAGQGDTTDILTRTDLPLAHDDAAASVIEGTMSEHRDEMAMCRLTFPGGEFWLPQARTQAPALGTRMRIRIHARDVSLSLVKPEHTSILNILPARVTDVSEDGPGQVLVGLSLDQGETGSRLLARISRLSCERLAISAGTRVYAQIKGVAMVR
ncbi:molybdenum ABC transporter ATP-binding protein [Hydrogenophaga sp. 5NK40-0174]|uniref:molybdenum ABC transporter ATP-binding protein n=1 Tax=Hydrogenophaga sp. 5NK40-0174 TaxID=3127649 RepID=UPI003106BE3B